MSQLVTGEAVALDLRPARLVSRSIAAAIDIVIELVALVVLLQLAVWTAFADTEFAGALLILTAVMFVIGYPVAFETLWRGRTPGKAALGIRVVRDDGGPIRFRHALTRALFNIVERPGFTMGSAAVIASLLSIKGKRIGDMVAGTFVLQERLPKQHMVPIHMPPQLAAWAATLDLSRLPDDLALAVRGFLSRSGELRPDARDRLGSQLAAAVAACTSPGPPAGTPGWAYLAAVIAERRRREEARNAALGRASPWQPPPPTPGWSPPPGAPPGSPSSAPPWSASAPPTGSPPPVGPPPPVGEPPHVGAPPRLPGAPSPQWGPQPVPPSPPPGSPARAPERAPDPAPDEPPPKRGSGGFAAPA